MPLHDSEVKKYEAETEEALAAAEKHRAEARFHEQEERKSRIAADLNEIVLRAKIREEKNELAKDYHHKVYVFDKQVTESSVKECIQTLTRWVRQEPGCPVELQINSPGGSIFDGLALVDFLRGLQSKGHKITTIALGMAASMGGVLLQVGDKRVMGKNAILLIHEGSLGAIGDFGEVEDRLNLMKLFHERILDIFEERARPLNPKTTKAFIKKNWERKDWWLTADQAQKLGFCDEIS